MYRLVKIFKHDFFAATALYEGKDGRIVMKMGRVASLFGIPMRWAGRQMTRHEVRLYSLCQDIKGVPRLISIRGDAAFAHEYVEGGPLELHSSLSDAFFRDLERILEQMHARGVAYVDLEKRENILLGVDGSPHLIDFQIAWHLPAARGGGTWLARRILRVLQASDRYHLLKHWRRMRPEQLTPEQVEASRRPPFWIAWHRALFRPVTMLRRRILVRLGARQSAHVRSPG